MNYGDWEWNEAGVPPGEIWVLVDLKAQTMSVFRGAHEIGTAITLYGVDDKPTPTGRFTILEKREDHVSNLYNAPMPYMMRLTMDGVAIHGSDVREGAGTHGCLGVPLDFGARLFAEVERGTEVLVLADAKAAGATLASAR
jgi:lipoprotein-anchoring transpeptidase ErfK/SrfK